MSGSLTAAGMARVAISFHIAALDAGSMSDQSQVCGFRSARPMIVRFRRQATA